MNNNSINNNSLSFPRSNGAQSYDLNVSASTVDVTTLKASDVNFAGLPTSDPLVTGSLWVSGSATSGSFKSGYVMISGIHG